MNEATAHLALSILDGVGSLHFKLLMDYFGSARKIWSASEEKLVALGITRAKAAHIGRFRTQFDETAAQKQLNRHGMWYIAQCDDAYPAPLRQLADSPIGLFGRGDQKRFAQLVTQPLIAVVGSRKMTSYGRRITEQLVGQLVAYGIGIVSGMMYGVDETAHKAALEGGGATIGVWAGGIDTVMVGSRQKLAEQFLQSNVAVIVSEFPPGLTPSKGTFPSRNRIVSGLSLGAVVIEGATDSGSLITARLAGEQGREVFAVPGPIDSRQSAGPLRLIKHGAKVVTSVKDILEELPIGVPLKTDSPVARYKPRNKAEETILTALKLEPMHSDELIQNSSLTATTVNATLSLLELHGIIERLDNGKYAVNLRS